MPGLVFDIGLVDKTTKVRDRKEKKGTFNLMSATWGDGHWDL